MLVYKDPRVMQDRKDPRVTPAHKDPRVMQDYKNLRTTPVHR
jgi:hypothetical protein